MVLAKSIFAVEADAYLIGWFTGISGNFFEDLSVNLAAIHIKVFNQGTDKVCRFFHFWTLLIDVELLEVLD